MGRTIRTKKTDGRKKGPLKTCTAELFAVLNEFEYDPVRQLLTKYSQLDSEQQIKIDLKLLEHVYPKIKKVDLEEKKSETNLSSLSDEELEARTLKVKEALYREPEYAKREIELLKKFASDALNEFLNESKATSDPN